MDRRTILVGIGGIAVGILLAFYAFNRPNTPGGARSAESPDLLAAINRVADAQSEQSQRLDRLEQLYARSTGSAGLPAMRPQSAPVAGTGPTNGPALSPAQLEARTSSQMQALNDRLVSDPVSPQWAAANEKTIGDFLSPANLGQQHLPVPSNTRTVCHSHLCRISMTFPDESQASATEAMMLMQIAPSLSNALTFQVPHPDGSVEMVVFAGDAQHIR